MARPDVVVRYGADMTAVDNSMRRLETGFRRLKGLAAGFGVTLAASGIASLAKETLAWGDSIAKTADQIGLGTDALQAMQFAADQSGVAVGQFNQNMVAFVKRVGEARSGIGPLTSFLKKYDQTLLENIRNSRNQEEALGLIADAIKNASTATDRAAIANAAFSRSGIGMVNMLRDGRMGLEEFSQAARDAGLVVENSLIRSAEILQSEWDKAMRQMEISVKRFTLQVFQLFQAFENLPLTAQLRELQKDAAELQLELIPIAARIAEIQGDPTRSVWLERYTADAEVLRGKLEENFELQKKINEQMAPGGPQLPDISLPNVNAAASMRELKKVMEDMTGPASELNRLFERGASVTRSVRTKAEEYKDTLQELLSMVKQNAITPETFDRALIQAAENFKGIDKQTKAITNSVNLMDFAFESAFEDAILNGEKLGDVLKGLAMDIAKIFIRQNLTAPLASAASGFFSNIFGGAFADGGIAPGGKWSLVGERGPELIRPATSMAVMPNGTGGGSVIVNNSWDFSGANPATLQLLRQESGRIVEMSKGAVLQAIEQGGSYARSVGRRV